MLNLHHLNHSRRLKEQNKKKTYKKLLKKCHHRITFTASKSLTSCVFQIPEYVPGLPLFDIEKCRRYLIRKLRKNKFKVALVDRYIIYISWEHIPIHDREAEENTKPRDDLRADMLFRDIDDYKPARNFIYDVPDYKQKLDGLLR